MRRLTVSKHNVRHSRESTVEVGVNSGLDARVSLVLNTHTDHGDDDGSQDTDES